MLNDAGEPSCLAGRRGSSWPTIEALAAASLGDVIRAWQGPGYNRRAVNLHRAA
jgi:adenine-specific DNA glycosylase